jgi:hypothetical protein
MIKRTPAFSRPTGKFFLFTFRIKQIKPNMVLIPENKIYLKEGKRKDLKKIASGGGLKKFPGGK